MVDPVNPFNPKDLEKYKQFFLPPERKGFPSAQELEKERRGLASFLGTTDYAKQLEEAQNLSRLQLGLQLAQRGFAAAGATPREGESSFATVSRELFSPLAGDAGAIATQMMRQRQAINAAKRQEDRQLKLSALQNVQRRQDQASAQEQAAEQQARQFMLNVLKKDDTVSNDYLVDGKNIPLIARKGWTGEIEGFYKLDGKTKVDKTKVKIYRDTKTLKPITSWLTDVQVKGPSGNWIPAPGALRIADATGKNSQVIYRNKTLNFDPNSTDFNARIVSPASKDSPYYAPTTRPVFLNKTAIELFGLDSDLAGQKALVREYLVRPDMSGENIQPIKELVVGGKSFRFDQHRGYNPETGNITVERGGGQPPVTYQAIDFYREEDPKVFTPAGTMTVPFRNVDAVRAIPGLSGITSGEVLTFERNKQGKTQIRRGSAVVPLTEEQAALLQTRPLSEAEKVQAGQVVETKDAFVNTSESSLTINGKTVGPNQIAYLTKTDQAGDSFQKVADKFRQVGPVSTEAVTYMVKGATNNLSENNPLRNYAPGDEIRFTPQQFNNLDESTKKLLTEDPQLEAQTLKKNYFKALWKDVIQREGLTARQITENDLYTLLGMFPAGMRSGGKNLRDEIYSMLKFGQNANQNTSVRPSTSAALSESEKYSKDVLRQLNKAEIKYNKLIGRGALPDVDWDSLNFERKRAFADLPSSVPVAKVNAAWISSEERLQRDKAAIKPLSPEDVASYSSATELLILAKHLRDSQEMDQTGRFGSGLLSELGANFFADTKIFTSPESQRLQQIINRMKASYATLSQVEGGGRDSVFRQKLQSELIPKFQQAEKLNRKNLQSLISRLETNLRSVFTQETTASNVIPKALEIMAKEAGITGVSVNQKRYRWLDPNQQITVPVTRLSTMQGIDILPFTFADALSLKSGQLLPPPSSATVAGKQINAQTKRFVKIRNFSNDQGDFIVIQEATASGKPKSGATELRLDASHFSTN